MNKEKVLEDINIILEGNLQRLTTSSGRGMRIPYSDKSVELLNKLSQKLSSEEYDYFWDIITKPFTKELIVIPFPILKKTEEQRAISNISNNFGRVFEFLIKANKMDIVLNFFQKERNIDYKVVGVLGKIRELLGVKYAGFNRKILIKIEEYVARLVNQISRESQYERVFTKYEIDVANESTIVAINGVTLDVPIKPTKPTEPRKNYLKADYQNVDECNLIIEDVSAKIKLRKLEILEEEYEGINLEINQDQESLKATIKDFGFSSILNESLEKIKQHLYEAKDEFDFKTSISLIRSFLNELCISIGSKIEEITKIKHSEPIKNMGRALAYFDDKKIKFLSESEFKLLSSFNNFISDKGVHSLKSNKEYARIAKNFVVELGLFLVKRLEKYIDDFNNKTKGDGSILK